MRILLIAIIGMVCSVQSHGQASIKALDKYLKKGAESGNVVPQLVFQDKKSEGKIVQFLDAYLKDSNSKQRKQAISILARVGEKSKNRKVKTQVLNILSAALGLESDINRSKILSSMTRYSIASFSNESQKNLLNAVQDTSWSNTDNIILISKLCGYLNLKNAIPMLTQRYKTSKIFSVKWACQMALIRLGNKEATSALLEKLKRAPLNDGYVYDVLPDLLYTHNTEVYEVITKHIQVKNKGCTSSDPDNPAEMDCGYRMMEMIIPYCTNSPLNREKSTGELEVSNYRKALKDLRDWLAKGNSFEIDSNRY